MFFLSNKVHCNWNELLLPDGNQDNLWLLDVPPGCFSNLNFSFFVNNKSRCSEGNADDSSRDQTFLSLSANQERKFHSSSRTAIAPNRFPQADLVLLLPSWKPLVINTVQFLAWFHFMALYLKPLNKLNSHVDPILLLYANGFGETSSHNNTDAYLKCI